MSALNGKTIPLVSGLKPSIDLEGSAGSAGATVTLQVMQGQALVKTTVTINAAQPDGTIAVTLTDPETGEVLVNLSGNNSGDPRTVRHAPALTDNEAVAIGGQYTQDTYAQQTLALVVSGGNPAADAVTVKLTTIATE